LRAWAGSSWLEMTPVCCRVSGLWALPAGGGRPAGRAAGGAAGQDQEGEGCGASVWSVHSGSGGRPGRRLDAAGAVMVAALVVGVAG